jgi:hydrogenase nickel incorporation protein HypA/HybF
MHELSIAEGLIDVACEAAQREGDVRVTRLVVRIGKLSGIVREALEFAFGLAAEGSVCQGAELEIEEVPITVLCPGCREAKGLADDYAFVCPTCGSPTPEILTGRELEMVSLEVAGATANC